MSAFFPSISPWVTPCGCPDPALLQQMAACHSGRLEASVPASPGSQWAGDTPVPDERACLPHRWSWPSPPNTSNPIQHIPMLLRVCKNLHALNQHGVARLIRRSLHPALGSYRPLHGHTSRAASAPPAGPGQGGAIAISPTARSGGSSSLGPQLELSRKRGPWLDPPKTSPLPLGSLTAPRPRQRSTKAAVRAKETARIYSVTHVTSLLRSGAPNAPPAPGTPRQSFLEPRSLVWRGTEGG